MIKQFFNQYKDDMFFLAIVSVLCGPIYYTSFKEWQLNYKKKQFEYKKIELEAEKMINVNIKK